MHRDPANLEDSSSDVVPPCANTALMEAEKADRLKEQLTLQSGYLAGTEPYLITSRFVAYAAFECAKEPIAMYLAVRIFVDNIDMNGPLLTFGDRLPETVDVDKFTEAFPNDSATGRLPDPNDWCILNFGDHFNSLIAGPTQSSCCNDADHHKKALQTFIGHFMAIKASGDHDYDRILLLRGLMPDNQPELADGNQIMAAMGVSTGIDSSSAVDTDSDLEAMLDVEIAKVKKPRASRSKAAIVEDIKRSPRIASKAIVIMGLGDDEAGGKLPTDGEVSLQPYRGKTSKLAKTKISKQTLKTPISSGKQQKLTGSKSTGAKVSVTKLSRPATVVAAAEVTAGGNCETARTSTPKPPTAATPALTTMAGSGLTHASFMQQNYDALNFGNAQIDSFLFRAERYVRGRPETSEENATSTPYPHGSVAPFTPVLTTPAYPTHDSKLELPPHQEAWEILHDDDAWLCKEDKALLSSKYGFQSRSDLQYLAEDDINDLANKLKIIRKRKFLEQFKL